MQLNDQVTLNGILQDIYFSGKITATTFPANDLKRIVNKYYRILQADIRGVSEDFFGELWTMDLKTNYGGTLPGEVTFPTDYEKIIQIQAAYSPVNITSPQEAEFEPVTLIYQNQITEPGFKFSMPTAVIFDNSFILQSLPPQNVTNGLRVYGIVQQPDLSADTDKPNIFADYQDAISWGSLIDVAVRKGEDTLFKKAVGMFKQRREEMKSYASARVPNTAGAFVEGQQGQGGWDYTHGHNPAA